MGKIALCSDHLRLYLVTDPALCQSYGLLETVRDAVAGGVTMVQLRDKQAATQTLINQGHALKTLLAPKQIPLIVNDNIDVAIAIGADGIHVGQSDMPVSDVRQRVGKSMLIGLSCETLADAQRVDPTIVDYIGIGPIFATVTKTDHRGPVGLSGLRAIAGACPLPNVAIGGLKLHHCQDLIDHGADGVAVVSAICGETSPKRSAEQLFSKINHALNNSANPQDEQNHVS